MKVKKKETKPRVKSTWTPITNELSKSAKAGLRAPLGKRGYLANRIHIQELKSLKIRHTRNHFLQDLERGMTKMTMK